MTFQPVGGQKYGLVVASGPGKALVSLAVADIPTGTSIDLHINIAYRTTDPFI
jgi:hypothetical protein